MSDVLLKIGENGPARQLFKKMGLPLSLPTPLRRAEGAWQALPLAGHVLVVGPSSSELAGCVRRIVEGAGAEVRLGGDIERAQGLVFDAMSLAAPDELRAVYEFFQPLIAKLALGGRVVVLARPVAEAATPSAAAAQGALEGFLRSLAKEVGKKGATAQLVRIAAGAEDGLAPLLRFLLSARSAFITGQVLSLDKRGHALGAAPFVRPLQNKVALVTGAARGIGEATARRLASEGAHVVCLDRPRDAAPLTRVASAINGAALLCDVSDSGAPQAIADKLRREHGGVDVVVHNAGLTRDKTLQRMSLEQWLEVIDINLSAVVRIDQALSSLLRDDAREVYVASIAGIAGTVGQTNYAAAKAGLISYMKQRASLLAMRGITANAVAPGLIETRLTAAMPVFVREAGRRLSALGQGGQPLDVAEAITFLASPGAAGINGSVLRVCGGAFLGA